jgi:hypothetical protein
MVLNRESPDVLAGRFVSDAATSSGIAEVRR